MIGKTVSNRSRVSFGAERHGVEPLQCDSKYVEEQLLRLAEARGGVLAVEQRMPTEEDQDEQEDTFFNLIDATAPKKSIL